MTVRTVQICRFLFGFLVKKIALFHAGLAFLFAAIKNITPLGAMVCGKMGWNAAKEEAQEISGGEGG